ncbi:ferredoxin [Rhodococcus sp. IEGM 1381]|uniref:ferredoxin n=1 Tax=Rhodococcus sp. IEGM 1381 TaxID=3047085 RepID=UPI0024B716CE|nr:ferredoxin [Rhodococcus sp. IEGM 1381]MDI9897418.1 ferredoxin [Rhodococcus sp. IEGM 1381]
MKVNLDLSVCQGYANCLAAAPEFFDIDDRGQAVLLKIVAETAEEQAAVLAAIPMCPVMAISVDEG